MNSIDFSNINQAELSKQYLSSAAPKDLFQFEHINFTPESFIEYTKHIKGVGKQVLDFILKFRGSYICLKNKTISNAIGCHVKTVQRWTNRFVDEGILIKKQVNRYAPNHFYLHPRLKHGDISWALVQDNLTPEQKDLYIQTGTIVPFHKLKFIQPETVRHNHSSSSSLSLSINISIQEIMRVNSRAYARLSFGPRLDPLGLVSTKKYIKRDVDRDNLSRKVRVRRGIMLSGEHKKYIVKNKSHKDIKNYVNSDVIRPLLFTPLMERIVKEYEIKDDYTKFKLLAFSDLDLESIRAKYEESAKYTYGGVKNKESFFMKMLNQYIDSSGVKPDWEFWSTMVSILEVKAPSAEQIAKNKQRPGPGFSKAQKEDKPYVLDRSKVSPYSPLYVNPKEVEMPVDVRIRNLQSELDSLHDKFKTMDFSGPFQSFLKPIFEKQIVEKTKEIEDLKLSIV